jgi:hypothetical protein
VESKSEKKKMRGLNRSFSTRSGSAVEEMCKHPETACPSHPISVVAANPATSFVRIQGPYSSLDRRSVNGDQNMFGRRKKG